MVGCELVGCELVGCELVGCELVDFQLSVVASGSFGPELAAESASVRTEKAGAGAADGVTGLALAFPFLGSLVGLSVSGGSKVNGLVGELK
jgi:hypothetical protein